MTNEEILREAVKEAIQYARNGIELGYIKQADPPDRAHDFPERMEAVLKATEEAKP